MLDELTGDIDSITDKKAVALIKVLINLVEMLAEENARLKETVQELKDEINRLKGEQGKPNIREQKKDDDDDDSTNPDHSSEKDRNKRGAKKERESPKIKKHKPFALTGGLPLNLIRPHYQTMLNSKGMSSGSYKI